MVLENVRLLIANRVREQIKPRQSKTRPVVSGQKCPIVLSSRNNLYTGQRSVLEVVYQDCKKSCVPGGEV